MYLCTQINHRSVTNTSRDIFYRTITDWAIVPPAQREGWTAACADVVTTVYWVGECLAFSGHVRTMWGLRYLTIDGVCRKSRDIRRATLAAAYREIYDLPYHIIEYNDDLVWSADDEVALRQAGWLRPVGLNRMPMTNLIDLTQPLRYSENWRRNIRHAEGLTYRECGHRAEDAACLWELYQSMCAAKSLRPWPTQAMFTHLLSDPSTRLFVAAHEGQDCYFLLIHSDGSHAGLLYAGGNSLGYDQRAGFYLYDCVLQHLQREAYRSFDMEKTVPSAVADLQAVFTYKTGIRGTLTPLLGEWSRYRRHWMRWAMYFLKTFIWHRREI